MAEATDPSAIVQVLSQTQLVIDALPRAIVVVDLDATIVGWNQVAEHLYGWSAQEALGRSLYELITPPGLRAVGSRLMEGVLAGEPWSGDISIVRRDGERLTTYSHLGPLRDETGRVVGALGSANDVTDVRRLEREANQLADHLLLALEAGQLGTWRWDRTTDSTTWDAATYALFDVDPLQFEGTYEAWRSRLHPDDIERVVGVVDRAVEDKSGYEIEHRVRWRDGSLHWIQGRGRVILDDQGEVVGTIGCTIDITERKAEEQGSILRALEAERVARRESLQRERLEFLVQLNDLALHATDHRELMSRAAAAAVPRLGDWCSVHFARAGAAVEAVVAHSDPDKVEWAKGLREEHPLDPNGEFGVPAVMRTGRTEFFSHVDRYRQDPSAVALAVTVPDSVEAIVAALEVTSVITVPLLTKRGVVGAVQFVSAESGRRYDHDDVALAEAAAGRIAAALEGAWLGEQQREIATTLQAALLPKGLPEIPGIDVAVRYWAAGAVSEVGGDFYDVFPIGEQQWAVVIGDVCGTGAQAAAITSIARHTLRAAATHGATPVEVLHWVNEAILSEGGGQFCTLLYSTLAPVGDGSWRWVCVAGGHPLPLLAEADGSVSHRGVHGTLLGALETIEVTAVETILGRAATVVLHTDGVNDIRPPHRLDDRQLRDLVADAIGSSDAAGADQVAERIGTAIDGILPIPDRDDDIAIVVLRVL